MRVIKPEKQIFIATPADTPPNEEWLAKNCPKCGKLYAPWIGVCLHCNTDYRPKTFGCAGMVLGVLVIIVALAT